MKKFLLFTITGLILFSCESKITPDLAKDDNQIVIGTIETLYSNIINENQKFWVHVPKNLTGDVTEGVKFPVLYLLDGDAHFYSVTGMIKQLSTTNGNTVSPQMIVVGITNNDRTRDLTPTHMVEIDGDSAFVRSSGGGKNFLNYIEKELIPHIEKNYPASNYRTFVGHSLGGLTVIDALVDRPEIFDNYIAIDPSLWWDDEIMVKRADSALSLSNYENKALYLGIANNSGKAMDVSEFRKDTTSSNLKFVNSIEAKIDNGLLFKWKYYENNDHGSVPLITEYDALYFLFPWYTFKEIEQIFDPNLSVDELLELIDSHYKNVSDHFGYESLPSEGFINSLGYALMNDPDKSYALLNLNVQNYPKSSNVYDSMGDYYLAQKDSIKALDFFIKALEVGENDYSQKKIDMLKNNSD